MKGRTRVMADRVVLLCIQCWICGLPLHQIDLVLPPSLFWLEVGCSCPPVAEANSAIILCSVLCLNLHRLPNGPSSMRGLSLQTGKDPIISLARVCRYDDVHDK